jgi:hypothetical protein
MRLQEIKDMARRKGIVVGSMNKTDLIQAFQLAEGNQPCFGTKSVRDCSQSNCLWREDCLKEQ